MDTGLCGKSTPMTEFHGKPVVGSAGKSEKRNESHSNYEGSTLVDLGLAGNSHADLVDFLLNP